MWISAGVGASWSALKWIELQLDTAVDIVDTVDTAARYWTFGRSTTLACIIPAQTIKCDTSHRSRWSSAAVSWSTSQPRQPHLLSQSGRAGDGRTVTQSVLQGWEYHHFRICLISIMFWMNWASLTGIFFVLARRQHVLSMLRDTITRGSVCGN